ncbi:hypothetical protein ACH4D5_24825 [Streptomyces sp. NPDC018029]|uniref:hypothetical protein n=1 Tax=Streptomyces sp. NPDC018029 TaxID=3365032 RepID=UPI0037A1E7CA
MNPGIGSGRTPARRLHNARSPQPDGQTHAQRALQFLDFGLGSPGQQIRQGRWSVPFEPGLNALPGVVYLPPLNALHTCRMTIHTEHASAGRS